ncbi:hypothetical protein [Planctomyces sp. SH-PL62]|uniref:hypothetical protein n=1 Tax=Planctomyces sp. SH-PL62 TaxID=1636152 RepID=UPI00078C08C2|nr:hypothetical protein [Planctomyces sp. SH-PL62]AMV37406.1 hypothetical protein VT85_08225 [Planctomyces sp. SH-PL62]
MAPEVRDYANSLPPRSVSFAIGFFTRMLFSCLVDADFLATEWFMDPIARRGAPTPERRFAGPGRFPRQPP